MFLAGVVVFTAPRVLVISDRPCLVYCIESVFGFLVLPTLSLFSFLSPGRGLDEKEEILIAISQNLQVI